MYQASGIFKIKMWCWSDHQEAPQSSEQSDEECGHQSELLQENERLIYYIDSVHCWYLSRGVITTCQGESWLVEVSGARLGFWTGCPSAGRSGWDRFSHTDDIVDWTIVVPTRDTTSLSHLRSGQRNIWIKLNNILTDCFCLLINQFFLLSCCQQELLGTRCLSLLDNQLVSQLFSEVAGYVDNQSVCWLTQ